MRLIDCLKCLAAPSACKGCPAPRFCSLVLFLLHSCCASRFHHPLSPAATSQNETSLLLQANPFSRCQPDAVLLQMRMLSRRSLALTMCSWENTRPGCPSLAFSRRPPLSSRCPLPSPPLLPSSSASARHALYSRISTRSMVRRQALSSTFLPQSPRPFPNLHVIWFDRYPSHPHHPQHGKASFLPVYCDGPQDIDGVAGFGIPKLGAHGEALPMPLLWALTDPSNVERNSQVGSPLPAR